MTLRALSVSSAPAGLCAGTVTLDHDARWRRRAALTTDDGAPFLLDLAEARELRDGEALMLEDGRHVLVRAAPERLTAIGAETPAKLARLAWHLGNRHLPVAIEDGRLLIRHDHVVEDMLRGLGASLTAVEAPFQPEGGAYGHGRTHAHAHAHSAHDDPNSHLREPAQDAHLRDRDHRHPHG
ncbi:MAG: urease accessory protein UreE [Rubrimonas sp.]|uniref:urease accessory protein UreE n=1 Tax=Rubrimonas sp. TaxID=2036015 RepID=UPI002FDDF975